MPKLRIRLGAPKAAQARGVSPVDVAMTLPWTQWLLITVLLATVGCTPTPETPRNAPAMLVGAPATRFPYRAPPELANTDGLARGAAAPASSASVAPSSPLALTTSDGGGLELKRLEARAVVDSMLAFTELRLTFHNPEPRVREGRFTLQLPPGAAVSRLAMKVNGAWQEAEVVERQQAQRVYEDFLHQRQDPALLEKKAGNEFGARIFPIDPSSDKELIVAYSEELARQEYRLPLAGLPRIGELDVRAQVLGEPGRSMLLGNRAERLLERDFVPSVDFRIRLEKPFAALISGNLVAIPIGVAPRAKLEPLKALAVGLDTSASRALNLTANVKQLDALVTRLSELHPELELTLFAFDQELRSIFRGPARAFDRKSLDQVLRDRALGASDLSIALTGLEQSGAARLVLFTDAVPTAGALEVRSLEPRLARLAARGARLDVIVSGAAHDRDLAEALVRGGGRVLDAELNARELAERLSSARTSDLVPQVANAEWIYPTRLTGLQPGEIRTIHARLKAPPQGVVRVTLGGPDTSAPRAPGALEVLSISMRAGERVLLERSVAGAEIRRLGALLASPASPAAEHATLKGTIVDVSRRYRVLSDWTAFLVLETEDDYTRYGIERNALSDILTVGDQGLTRVDRSSPPAPEGQQLEQFYAQKKLGTAFKSVAPRPPTPGSPGEGYGYEFSDDPLSIRGDVDDICAIDPDACARTDNRTTLLTAPLSETSSLRDSRPPACPPRRWAASARADRPCPSRRPLATAMGARGEQGDPFAEPLVEPYSGRFAEVMRLVVTGNVNGAELEALAWHDAEPLDTLALVALGEALEAAGKRGAAARAYGSLIDLYPSRADFRRFAAGRLERLGRGALWLSEDSYRKALEQRPDHVTSHQLLAYSLLRQARVEEAFSVLEILAQRQEIQSRELLEDVRLVAAVLLARKPDSARALALLKRLGLKLPEGPTTRVLLTWETDANDVDLHVIDRQGEHAYYEHQALRDGGTLLSDVTSGYGPEEFLLAPKLTGAPYELFVKYYARGPMGFGMGKIDVIAHDGNGHVRIDTRPFVIMNENATVHLGSIPRSAFFNPAKRGPSR